MIYGHDTKVLDAYLILEDGTIFQGKSFGAQGTTVGEVVFATGMTGYQESLTDPSYYGQIVTQTFPLIGNYGINDTDQESPRVWMKGYIVRDWCETPSNFRSLTTTDEFLKKNGTIGLYGIDTRALTRKLREAGVMNGMITTALPEGEDMSVVLDGLKQYTVTDAVENVSIPQKITYDVENPRCHVAMLDFGYKKNIRQSLHNRGCSVTVLPGNTCPEDIKALDIDGIMLTNGPGDPAENTAIIANLRRLLEETDLPILGICLGHQLMALAVGGQTEKLKYGHRGANQPVMDLEMDRIFVTSQNHGYAVVASSIPPEIGKVSHYNVNDKSCEGIVYNRPATFTVQFHPEASAGPQDTQYLFDRFVENMVAYQEKKGGK